jgi:hypothetical protein
MLYIPWTNHTILNIYSMKKKILLLCIALNFFAVGFSQDYHPLLDNPSWVVGKSTSMGPSDSASIYQGTDVTIGSYTYKQFQDPWPSYYQGIGSMETVYLREDIAERKVYRIFNGVDEVLYDYSLETGDTVSHSGYVWTATVDEVTVIGGTRKRITLDSFSVEHNNHSIQQIWIEGVGSPVYPFRPTRNMFNFLSVSGGQAYSTRCAFQNNEHIYGNPMCTDMVPLGVDELEQVSDGIKLLPNPFSTNLMITSELPLEDASFKLYNMQGQLVGEINHVNGNTISFSRQNLAAGVYFSQLSENGRTIKTAKIMVN